MPNLFNNQYENLASKGRFGDTMLAHINPQEAGLLRSMGGAGTINPQTGLREFYTDGRIPPPSTSTFQHTGGLSFKEIVTEPFDRKFADLQQGGMGVYKVTGYTLPTDDKKYAGIPLEAKYDPKGNFLFYTLQAGKYLTPDPNQPNIMSVPRINANGEVEDWGISDRDNQDNGSFGSFVRGLASDFGPMILAGLAAYGLAGSNILSGFGNAAGGVTGAAAADLTAAGVTTADLAAATTAGAAGGTLAGMGTGAAAAATTTAAEAAIAADAAAAAGGILGGGSTALTGGVADAVTGGITTASEAAAAAAAAAGGSVTPSMLQTIANATGISVDTLKTFAPSVISGLLNTAGSVLTSDKATEAAKIQSDAQIKAAQIAADAARFRPVGVTTRFGSSNFTTDAAGNVVTAGYTPSAEITGYQDRLRGLAGQGLTDVESARATYAPLSSAAQNLFSLGQGYLAKTPEQAAQEYIAKQTALLAPSRENQLAELRNRQFQTGRGGVAVSQGGNLMNTSPEMAAYYNSLAQQDLVLAANADEEARRRITYGAGLFDTGANLQGRYYTGQTAAYSPFTTAMDTSSGLERLAQQPLDLSTAIGSRVSTANANVGSLTGQGIINAASTMAPSNAYSVGGNLLSGAANSPVLSNAVNRAFGNTQQTQQQYTFNPATGQYVPVQPANASINASFAPANSPVLVGGVKTLSGSPMFTTGFDKPFDDSQTTSQAQIYGFNPHQQFVA
jgi:hypothetical protein